MPLQSDITVNASKFDHASVSENASTLNENIIKQGQGNPQWWVVGAAKYREMRMRGETQFPKPVFLPDGKDITLPSREQGRSISCRVMAPESGQSKGVFLHIHGGGWVLMSARFQDTYLKALAEACQITAISVEYRLAPEHPYPAGINDCTDVAEYLVDNAKSEYGGDLLFAGGESAGAHLSMCTSLHLLASRPNFNFRGLVLNFGAYDLSRFLPQAEHFDRPLVLTKDIMTHFMDAYLPNMTIEQKRDPAVSPFFFDMYKLQKERAGTKLARLPPALFTCGTEDPLLDDTVMMGTKYASAGAETIVKIYPGAPHGFTMFPQDMMDNAKVSQADIRTYVTEKMAQ